jgi:hypothetical protein
MCKFGMLLALFSLFVFMGLGYLLFLQFVFPTPVPFYGGGESVSLSSSNDYTQEMPWEACSRLHLTLATNETVELYLDGKYLCDCRSYEFNLEPGEYIFVMLKSDSPVSGRFTAWQEIPYEKQALGLGLLAVGLVGLGSLFTVMWARKRQLDSPNIGTVANCFPEVFSPIFL